MPANSLLVKVDCEDMVTKEYMPYLKGAPASQPHPHPLLSAFYGKYLPLKYWISEAKTSALIWGFCSLLNTWLLMSYDALLRGEASPIGKTVVLEGNITALIATLITAQKSQESGIGLDSHRLEMQSRKMSSSPGLAYAASLKLA